MVEWREDVLGEDFVQADLNLPDGALATVVRLRQPGGDPAAGAWAADDAADPGPAPAADPGPAPAAATDKPAILYLHGFVDYFLQAHVARAAEARGYRFYGIDLRGYGRSLGRGVEEGGPNYTSNLAIYAQDLDAAVDLIRGEGHDRIVLMGHSTGGLIGPLWADSRPGLLEGMILNSPWLDLAENWFMRVPLTQIINVIGVIAPKLGVSNLGRYYGEALHSGTGGEWDYNLTWKPHEGFPVLAGWLRQVRRGQARIKRGLDIACPILVLTSTRKGPHRGWHSELITTDSVLDPEQMWARAGYLGPDVEIVTIEGGAHDLALSPEPARSQYLDIFLEWLDTHVAGASAARQTSQDCPDAIGDPVSTSDIETTGEIDITGDFDAVGDLTTSAPSPTSPTSPDQDQAGQAA